MIHLHLVKNKNLINKIKKLIKIFLYKLINKK